MNITRTISMNNSNYSAYSPNQKNSLMRKTSFQSRKGSNGNFEMAQRNNYEETIKALENEKNQLQLRLSHQNETFTEEKKALQKQIDDLVNQRTELMKKSALFSRLQNEIINLHLEFQDRTLEEDTSIIDVNQERKTLEKISPLTVLDYCRANLRILLTFKEDFEVELHSRSDKRASMFDETKKKYQKEITQLKDKFRTCSSDCEKLKTQFLNEKENAKKADNTIVELEHKFLIEKQLHSKEVFDLRNEIIEKNLEISELKKVMSSAEIKSRQIEKLESELGNAHADHRTNLTKFENETRGLIQQINEESRRTQILQLENEKLEEIIKKKDALLLSYKRNISVNLKDSLEAELIKTKTQLNQTHEKVEELETNLRKSKRANMTMAEKNLRMKAEYDKLQNSKKTKSSVKAVHIKQLEAALIENDALKNSLVNQKKEREELIEKVRQVTANTSNNLVAQHSRKLERDRVQKQFQKLKTNAEVALAGNYIE
eukprot:TRINITY_DN14561_c0_g1_i1.p1 TRINITY_DN14561_c0_g1~~TRINITY_DN14561_c0_g1_i1.p1  ORF type:complete len:489 (+),score=147.74 TRINITY_DN14561_c0_g1_i1:47-1513(+)